MRKTFWLREGDEVNEYYEDTGELVHHPAPLPPIQKHGYSEQLADLICQKIVEGVPMSDICKEPGFPTLHMIARWKRLKPEFAQALQHAREARAELLRDQALKAATGPMDKDDVPAAKLAVDTFKWAAEKDDPRTYGNKVDVSGAISVMQLVVDTGIQRGPILQGEAVTVSNLLQGEADETIHREKEGEDHSGSSGEGSCGDTEVQGGEGGGGNPWGIQQLDAPSESIGSGTHVADSAAAEEIKEQ
jgi:hypothetical protein